MTTFICIKIELWPVEKLIPYDRNARTHSDEQIKQITRSIQEFGFTNPIMVHTAAGILAGHARLRGALRAGLPQVPVIVLDHLSYWCGERDQGEVWSVDKPFVNESHPNMKPVELIERAIRNSSEGGELVLDPFGDSGSTLIACEKTGRMARLLEIDPLYVDVAVRRWQKFTGKQAIRAGDRITFDEIDAGGTG